MPNMFRRNLGKTISVFDEVIQNYRRELIQDYQKDFVYDWYGSLGTEELVLVINADSIKVFTDILEIIRMEKRTSKHLSSTYSFTFSNYSQIKAVDKLEVDSSISLTLNPAGNISEYLSGLRKKILSSLSPDIKINEDGIEAFLYENYKIRFFNMIGKYDYHIFIPKETWNFLEEFNEGGIFNSNTPTYRKNVFQIKTNWLYSGKDLDKYYDNNVSEEYVEIDNSKIDEYINHIRGRIKKLKNHPPEYLARARHIIRAIDLLYYDYKKNIRSIFATEWREDLYYQFDTFLKLLENYSDDIETQFSIIEESINSIRQTYIHITQASRMFFEIPATNLRYTGSFNKILRAYYGIVKQLFYITYSMKRTSKQSMLVPIITFEYTTKVNTHIYTQTKELSAERLVVFHLPYEALVNIPKYTQYLCHEVFHYVAPPNRFERNKLLFDITIYYYFYGFFKEIFTEYVKKVRSDLTDSMVKILVEEYLTINCDVMKNIVESIYFKIVPHNDEELSDKGAWFEQQSSKFFIQSLRECVVLPENTNRSKLIGLTKEALEVWVERARNFNEAEMEKIASNVHEQMQFQPSLQNEIIAKIFILKGHSAEKFIDKNEREMEYLDSKLINEILVRNEFIANSIMEAKCDYFTIQIMNLDLEQYLNFQFHFLYEYGVLENILSEKNTTQSSFMGRISIICDYYNAHTYLNNKRLHEEICKCQLIEKNGEKESKLFEQFLEYVYVNYEQYISIYNHYKNEILDDLVAETINADTISESQFESVRIARNELLAYCAHYNLKDENEKFRINIDMMERFQAQLSMKGLENVLKSSYIKDVKGKKLIKTENYINLLEGYSYQVEISNISEYMKEINAISTFLKPKFQTGIKRANLLWYRGHTDKGHILLPGLLRNWKREKTISPLEYEVALMDIFASRAMHVLETDVHLLKNTFDWLVQMQHYSMPTHLLDWSENAFVALFFALINKDDTYTDKDAAVYIMNPEYMELAREILLKDTDFESLQRRLYPIINLSTNYHNDINEDYLPFSDKNDINTRAAAWREDDTGKSPKWWAKPIVSSLLNVRIRAQYGAFTIFNLVAKPNYDKYENGYDYLSIENMQKEFLKKYPTQNPFLYKVIIKKEAVENIADDLKGAGYKTMNVYPELENISGAINRQVEAYFKN